MKQFKTNVRGMTLIELMITVAIVGILAAIAYPSYRQQVIRSGRTEAKVALEQAAHAYERCYTQNMTYVGCAVPTGLTPTGKYNVATGAAATATTFSLVATPQSGQATDAQCGTFGLNHQGARSVTGTLPVNQCW